MTYFFETYGCEMNIAESASVEQILIARGWKKAEFLEEADMVIVNTCSVRATAETRIFGRLGYFSGLKKVRHMESDAKVRSPEMQRAVKFVEKNGVKRLTVVVMGCMAERLLESLKKDWPVIDYVVGTFGKNHFGQIIESVEHGDEGFDVEQESVYKFASTSYEEGAFSTFVPIMHGCNNFCTYCIVPYVRGREISRPVAEILREVEILSERGVKEITLLGQNVNAYRGEDGMTFPKLLKTVSSYLDQIHSPIRWVRFESSNPNDFDDELIDVIANDSHLCRGLHIAVQHGSSRILKAMNRKYSREQYQELVKKLRERVEDVMLTTDIMVGFPGETEEDFQEVLTLMEQTRYQSAFMYYYNPREGTPAAKMENQIDIEVKKQRLQKVIDLQLKITGEVMAARVGRTVEVLVDIVSRDNSRELLGKTSQNERVAFEADPKLIGTFVKVQIDSLNGNTYKGHLIKE